MLQELFKTHCTESNVIKLICRDVIYFVQQNLKPKPNEPLVFLTAWTGSVTFNIQGITLHSVFMLNSSDYDNISWKKHSIMHTKVQKLVSCVVDGISMVSSKFFRIKTEEYI